MCKKRNVYTMAELSLAFMKLFNGLNDKLFSGELPKVVITFEAGFKKGAYGWIHSQKTWLSGKEEKYCINISADYLDRPIYEVCSTLLHEMCHLYAIVNDIQDTSRAGIYHNKSFKKIAESHGLHCECADKIGWSVTSLTEDTKKVVDSLCILQEIRLYMIKPKENEKKRPKKSSRRKYICPNCGQMIAATKEVDVICGVCFDIDNPVETCFRMVLESPDQEDEPEGGEEE